MPDSGKVLDKSLHPRRFAPAAWRRRHALSAARQEQAFCDNRRIQPAGQRMHLFVDISSHGFGHLAITAPVIHALRQRYPDLQLTVRSLLTPTQLQARLPQPFTYLKEASDFGYIMHDAIHVDLPASAAAYRQAHADWPQRVASEAELLRRIAPDLVLSNVSYLPLAGAAAAGIPAVAMCSLNWADLFQHHYGQQGWAQPIYQEILAAYRAASAFLCTTPAMPMPDFAHQHRIAQVAALGQRHELGLPPGERAVLIAMGGIALRLPVESWPRLPGIRWLLPASWQCNHPDALALESFGLNFTDLLCSVDAIVSKPGYGTFCEAACNGTPLLYQRRQDWPEQDCLIDWLQQHGRCAELSDAQLQRGDLSAALTNLWSRPVPPRPAANGAEQAASFLATLIAPLPLP